MVHRVFSGCPVSKRTSSCIAAGFAAAAYKAAVLLIFRLFGAIPAGRGTRGDGGSSLRAAMGSSLARLLPGESGTSPVLCQAAEPANLKY